jgi:hypothetical protein
MSLAMPRQPAWDRRDKGDAAPISGPVEADTSALKLVVVLVTPAMAAEWLIRNTHNRTAKAKAIARYAADMVAGRWHLNGETIKFSADGTLLDGQNRLMACVEAGVPFRTVVTWGVGAEGQETTDVGVRRGLADVLTLRGETMSKDLAAVIGHLWKFQRDPRDMSNTLVPSVPEALLILGAHPGLRESVRAADPVRAATGLRTSVGGTLHYITHTLDSEDASAFWERLTHGVGLAEDDPILRLRELLLADRVKSQQRLSTTRLWALTVKAWNAYREGRSVKLLTWRPGGAKPEAMPVPE